jgi:hypothetical protein
MSATNRGTIREAQDKYYTPIWCIDAILSELGDTSKLTFLEPCRGSGNIFNHPKLVVAEKRYAELDEGIDYLDEAFDGVSDLIVTNPPFSLALPFFV